MGFRCFLKDATEGLFLTDKNWGIMTEGIREVFDL